MANPNTVPESFIDPRLFGGVMTSVQRDAFLSKHDKMLIYNSTTLQFEQYTLGTNSWAAVALGGGATEVEVTLQLYTTTTHNMNAASSKIRLIKSGNTVTAVFQGIGGAGNVSSASLGDSFNTNGIAIIPVGYRPVTDVVCLIPVFESSAGVDIMDWLTIKADGTLTLAKDGAGAVFTANVKGDKQASVSWRIDAY